MTWAAGAVVLITGLWLIGFALVIVVAPRRAERFLRSFASSARAHYTEQVLRLMVGSALILFAAEMSFFSCGVSSAALTLGNRANTPITTITTAAAIARCIRVRLMRLLLSSPTVMMKYRTLPIPLLLHDICRRVGVKCKRCSHSQGHYPNRFFLSVNDRIQGALRSQASGARRNGRGLPPGQ